MVGEKMQYIALCHHDCDVIGWPWQSYTCSTSPPFPSLFISCIKAEGDLCWLFNEVQKLTYIISVTHTLLGKTGNTSIK